MHDPADLKGGVVALRHPMHVFAGQYRHDMTRHYFAYSDRLPPVPPNFLRSIGLNWLKDADLAYSVLLIVNKRNLPTRKAVNHALKRMSGNCIGIKQSKFLLWEKDGATNKNRVIVFVQSDKLIKRRECAGMRVVATSRRIALFDADDLQTGGWTTVS